MISVFSVYHYKYGSVVICLAEPDELYMNSNPMNHFRSLTKKVLKYKLGILSKHKMQWTEQPSCSTVLQVHAL